MKPASQKSYQRTSIGDDIVLQQFYQERKKRSITTNKRHSLLEKNSSFFSNVSDLNLTTSTEKTPQNNLKNSNYVSHGLSNLGFSSSSSYKTKVQDQKLKQCEAQIIKKYTNFNQQRNKVSAKHRSQKSDLIEESIKKAKSQTSSIISQTKSQIRQRNLMDIQSSFKQLTGQQPIYNFKKQQKSHSVYEPLKQDQARESTNEPVNSNQKPQRYYKPTSSNKLSQSNYISQNVNIVNNMRSSNKKNNEKVSIKQFVDTHIENNSFCKLKEEEEDDEPLIVLAQKVNNKQTKGNSFSPRNKLNSQQSRFSQFISQPGIYDNYNIPHSEFSYDYQASSPNFKIQSTPGRQQSSQMHQYNKPAENYSRNLKQKTSVANNSQKIRTNQESNSKVSQIHYNNELKNSKVYSKAKKEPFREKQNNMTSHQQQKILSNSEIATLQSRIEQLQKINKKQKKFIDSVQGMRKAIQKVDDDCNLKELWRWLKALPSR